MLAAGISPVYPCHVSARDMRVKPIGTGPFKFELLRQNEIVKLVKHEDYWKEGLPYLDGLEFQLRRDRSTRQLALIAGQVHMSSPEDRTSAETGKRVEVGVGLRGPRTIHEQQPVGKMQLIKSQYY